MSPWVKSLKGQMAISYVLVTLVSVLVSEAIILGIALIFLTGENNLSKRVQRTAEAYAEQLPSYFKDDGMFEAEFIFGSPGAEINPNQITFTASGIAIPYIDENSLFDEQKISLALLLSPEYRILESSYPRQYPVGDYLTQLLLGSFSLIESAQQGEVVVRQFEMEGISFLQTAVPIQSNTRTTPLGYVYVHAPNLLTGNSLLVGTVAPLLLIALLMTIIILPIGVVFGLLATRGHINRLQELTAVTHHFANNDFSQRIPIQRQDEMGELEKQFNIMAERIVESLEREKDVNAQKGAIEERERIAMEMHDSLSQDIFSLNMLTGGLQQALPDDHAIQRQIHLLQNTINHMIREMRALIIAMRPTLLEGHSFSEAVHTYVRQYSRLGIKIDVQIEDNLWLDQGQENALFRISQEAISNAVRHANSNRIDLSLKSVAGNTVLSIQDDGKGFDIEKANPGFGMKTMNGRVNALQGVVHIESSLTTGTKVTVTIPHDGNK
ncbi:hypothetical protein MNBD_CHLOROFLEXI01-2070 [hydrothermal vent metagenome]|uniref:histidine kinase n=2 Tax=hydrothermal vent metagenome TaxID=652676 RepID=A0A3B0UYS2_9ZZZZ